jgi:hypothetical protein
MRKYFLLLVLSLGWIGCGNGGGLLCDEKLKDTVVVDLQAHRFVLGYGWKDSANSVFITSDSTLEFFRRTSAGMHRLIYGKGVRESLEVVTQEDGRVELKGKEGTACVLTTDVYTQVKKIRTLKVTLLKAYRDGVELDIIKDGILLSHATPPEVDIYPFVPAWEQLEIKDYDRFPGGQTANPSDTWIWTIVITRPNFRAAPETFIGFNEK